MSHEQAHKPVTYGDVFPAVSGDEAGIANEPITTEDASMMQTAEAMAFGKTLKGGAASTMQSAAAKNVQDGSVERDAHSKVAEYGLSVSEVSVPGAILDIEYVAGSPVAGSARPTPTDPAIAALDAVTIGEALEAAAVGAGDRPVTADDARAILSAEARATGSARPMKGGIGATAQSAAQTNVHVDKKEQTTVADVLMDATSDLQADKVVTYEDAFKVLNAELRGRSVDDLQPGGVGASLVAAAGLNEMSGLIAPAEDYSDQFTNNELESEAEKKEDAAVAEEIGKYQPLRQDSSAVQPIGEEEKLPEVSRQDSEALPIIDAKGSEAGDTTPLISHDSEQLPSHGSGKLPTPEKIPEKKEGTDAAKEDGDTLSEEKLAEKDDGLLEKYVAVPEEKAEKPEEKVEKPEEKAEKLPEQKKVADPEEKGLPEQKEDGKLENYVAQ